MKSEAETLSHVDAENRAAMVDVSAKIPTQRTARARAVVFLPVEVRRLLVGAELQSKKGPVFQTAILAGTMAAKQTSALIPLCHPLPLEKCKIEIALDASGESAVIECEVGVHHRTGVEMEALTGASVAALTIYDMCKAVSHDMIIREVRLLSKTGGKSDYQA